MDRRPSIIRPRDYTTDADYEPPLMIGFGIDSSTVQQAPAAMGKSVIPPAADTTLDPHYHNQSDACIHIISGALRFFFGPVEDGDDRMIEVAHGGDFVHIPRGTIHGVRNESDTDEVHLVFCYPGVPDKEAAETIFVNR